MPLTPHEPDLTAAELSAWLDSQTLLHFDDGEDEQSSQPDEAMGSWLDSHGPSTPVSSRMLANELGIVLEGVLSRRECQRMIVAAEQHGFGQTSFPKHWRGNQRVMLDDTSGALARQLWDRVRPYVPPVLEMPARPRGDDDEDHTSGQWVPTGLNTRFRLSKYFPGDRFAPHSDASISFSPHKATMMTLNIYLNDLDPEQHGRTLFYATAATKPVDVAGGVAGSLALFRQRCVRHEGEPLASGLKYLLRTDVVYEKLYDDAVGPRQAASAPADHGRGVQFSSCTIHTFGCGLDSSKLPSDGEAPLGLADLVATRTVALGAWEPQRMSERRHTAGLYVGLSTRRACLQAAGVPPAELEEVSRENAALLSSQAGELGGAIDGGRVMDTRNIGGGKAHSQCNATAGATTTCSDPSSTEPERTGMGGGWHDLDNAAGKKRQERAVVEQRMKRQRREEGKRCSECRRFACISASVV